MIYRAMVVFTRFYLFVLEDFVFTCRKRRDVMGPVFFYDRWVENLPLCV